MNIHDYTIDQTFMCFCIGSGVPVHITVQSDTIAQVIRCDTTLATSLVSVNRCLTIDSLFKIIQFGRFDSIVVTYNERYGYPEVLDIDPQMHARDGGIRYETANFQLQRND